ncbi:MAG: hypothetical protein PVF83_02925 [Anaerolineales bacterium]|jgi:hypothetical protein
MSEGNHSNNIQNHVNLRRLGLVSAFVGLFFFLFGADPGLFGLDRSEAIGFVQVGLFTFGLLLICFGGTMSLNSLWPERWKSIAADIGLRITWTGFIIAMASGMADIFGLGTRPIFSTTPFFGFWQARGVLFGEIVIVLGLLMMIPYRKPLPPPDEGVD